jgi:hypothetical protein
MNVAGPEPPSKTHRHVLSRRIARIAVTLLAAVLAHAVATVTAQYLWFRTSDLYGETMYIVRTSPELETKIGAPIVAGWPLVFRSVYRGTGEVSARLPVYGARGPATVRLRAKNGGGSWEYQQLDATIDAESAVVDLMPHPWRPQQLVLRGSGQLYFVGIGESSRLDVSDLARYYGDRYQLDPIVLPPLSYQARWQSAEQMIRVLKAGFPHVVADPQAVIIAVTEVEMDWFSWRDDGRFAVVSTARLTPDQFRKQVSKSLGLLWFELPRSTDSRSVLYDAVGGRIDLDLMSDEF